MIPGIEKSQVTFSFLHGYLAILLKHSRLILLLSALSGILALGYHIFAKQIYQTQVEPIDWQYHHTESLDLLLLKHTAMMARQVQTTLHQQL